MHKQYYGIGNPGNKKIGTIPSSFKAHQVRRWGEYGIKPEVFSKYNPNLKNHINKIHSEVISKNPKNKEEALNIVNKLPKKIITVKNSIHDFLNEKFDINDIYKDILFNNMVFTVGDNKIIGYTADGNQILENGEILEREIFNYNIDNLNEKNEGVLEKEIFNYNIDNLNEEVLEKEIKNNVLDDFFNLIDEDKLDEDKLDELDEDELDEDELDEYNLNDKSKLIFKDKLHEIDKMDNYDEIIDNLIDVTSENALPLAQILLDNISPKTIKILQSKLKKSERKILNKLLFSVNDAQQQANSMIKSGFKAGLLNINEYQIEQVLNDYRIIRDSTNVKNIITEKAIDSFFLAGYHEGLRIYNIGYEI